MERLLGKYDVNPEKPAVYTVQIAPAIINNRDSRPLGKEKRRGTAIAPAGTRKLAANNTRANPAGTTSVSRATDRPKSSKTGGNTSWDNPRPIGNAQMGTLSA